MTATASAVLLKERSGYTHLQLNRPETSNGLGVPLLKDLHAALMECHQNPNLRVLMFTGAGKNFCAGGDVKDFASHGEALPDYLREATAWLSMVTQSLLTLPAPVVTLVQGYAAGGGGVGLVCASDIVIAGRSAHFMSGATRVGMAPDGGSTVTLSRLIGHRKALEFTLLNTALDAEQALEYGLITRVVDDADLTATGDEIAAQLATGPTKALAATKRLMWDGLGRSVEQALPDEARTVSELSGTHDAREGLAAVIERRAPTYQGR
jgi:2-(1,2-epoxy-1,2-dihydrophenyl)acetyl-CoA isomerase